MNVIIKSIGKRKTSIARVILKEGLGSITINNNKSEFVKNKTFEEYFAPKAYLKSDLLKPLYFSKLLGKLDIIASVCGGGIMGQLEAIRLAITKGICKFNFKFRKKLKKNKLLTRDSRIKERRKYGLKKARKAPQYHKR